MQNWSSLPPRALPTLLLAALLALGALPARQAAVAQEADTSRAYVELRSGERVYGRVRLEERGVFRADVFVVGRATRVPADSVVAYRTAEGFFRRTAEGNAFARRIGQGRLHTYAVRAAIGPDERLPERPRPLDQRPVVAYFATGPDAPVRKLTRSHLAPVVANYAPSARLVRRHRTLTRVQYGLLGAGAATSVAGFALGGDGVPVVGIAGLGVAMLAYVPYRMRQGTLRDAVRVYNKR
jgi:hypothetical protein